MKHIFSDTEKIFIPSQVDGKLIRASGIFSCPDAVNDFLASSDGHGHGVLDECRSIVFTAKNNDAGSEKVSRTQDGELLTRSGNRIFVRSMHKLLEVTGIFTSQAEAEKFMASSSGKDNVTVAIFGPFHITAHAYDSGASLVKKFPIEDCEKCHQVYVACKSCGKYSFDMSKEGKRCECKRGNLEKTELLNCCHRTWHHLGMTCPHCGQVG